jgi:hypothetical protein
MRVLARIGSALAVLALAAPAAVIAQTAPPDSASMPNLAPTPDVNPVAVASTAPHRHRLFGRRHCVECQRAALYQKKGIVVPPPPSVPGAELAASGNCADCGKPVMAMKNPGTGSMNYVHMGDAAPAPPGIAMVGDMPSGEGPAAIGMYNHPAVASSAPGFASVGGPKGPQDSALMQTGAASTPLGGHEHNRPHIILHTLNLDGMAASRAERAQKKKSAHASISYGPANQQVSELPAKMVYGK